ncbi:MAG: PIN domain-containing protein [Bacillota bacterium]
MTCDINKQFVDTNILVYCYDASSKNKHIKAKELLIDLWEKNSGCLSIQVMQEFYVIVTQKVPVPLNKEKVIQILEDFSQWSYHIPDAVDVIEAINIQERNKISFWDAMIINSAKASGCGIIWSEDLSHDQSYEGVKVLNPFIDFTDFILE